MAPAYNPLTLSGILAILVFVQEFSQWWIMPFTIDWIKDKKVTVGVVGLVYVGLLLSLAFVNSGVNVIGFDIDPNKVSVIAKNQSYIQPLSSEQVEGASSPFCLTADFKEHVVPLSGTRVSECSKLLDISYGTSVVQQGNTHIYVQYNVRAPLRNRLSQQLKSQGIPANVYYPKRFLEHSVFAPLGHKWGDFPVSGKFSREMLNLPMHPSLDGQTQDQIINAIEGELAHV